MRDVCCEVTTLLFGALQFTEHFVEATHQFAEHVGIVFRHAHRKVAIGHRVDGVEDLFHRLAKSEIQAGDDEECQKEHHERRTADQQPNVPYTGEFRECPIEKGCRTPNEEHEEAKEEERERKESAAAGTLTSGLRGASEHNFGYESYLFLVARFNKPIADPVNGFDHGLTCSGFQFLSEILDV